VSPVRTPYSQPVAPSQAAPKGLGLYSSREYESNLTPWLLISFGSHCGVVFAVWLLITLLGFFGWIPKLDNLAMKPRDVEFVLVDNLPNQKPRKPTKNRAEHDSRSGGKKIANRPVAMPQQAAGAPSKAQKSSAPPAPKPQQATRQSRPAQQPKVAQAPSRMQPRQQQQAPTPQPAPPAPKLPKPTKIASNSPSLPPSPVAPTIRTPAPANPTPSMGGPVARTPSGSSGTSGSSGASGSPGPSLISGAPSRGGGNGFHSGRPGQGGGGGTGAYNQSGSPGGGGGQAGIDAEAEPDFGPYIAELQRRIRRNWAPPMEDRSKRIVANFRIGRDGRLLSLTIQQSSGSPPADQAALAAVRASAPFRPLPPNYRGKDIPVQFTFDYEITGHGSASMR
jgi:TonB family protein